MANSALKILNETIQQFINIDFDIETPASDCQFTEGPVWNAEGYYLFSDIDGNCIYKLSPGNQKELFLEKSGTQQVMAGVRPDHAGSNALAYITDGELLICQHGDGAVAKLKDSTLHPFIATYNGQRFNSPNDMVMAKDGSLFFSDPPYGLLETKLAPMIAQPAAGVYCYKNGETSLFCDKYQYPNGVCLNPDETEVMICSTKPNERFISVYDAKTLAYKRRFAEENGDGMKCDPHGNVYLCTKEGILILDKEGKRMGLLSLEAVPSNMCWGGADRKDLFITAQKNVFLTKNFLR